MQWTYQANPKTHSPLRLVIIFNWNKTLRMNPAGSNLLSAFVGATTATLFPNTNTTLERDAVYVASGTQLERDLMELIGDPQQEQEKSPT